MPNMITNLIKLILIISLLSACDQSTQNKQHTRGSRAKLVLALPVKKLSVGTQQHVSGSLTAIQTVKIFNQEPGQIKKLPYFQGDNVTQGKTIVFIKNDTVTALLAKSTASRLQAKSNLNRLSKLMSKNLTSHDEISNARTVLALAKAEESINQIRLNNTFIKAPLSGVISERFQEPGDVVPLHTHILSIIDNSRLLVKVQISEILLSQLFKNSKVTITIDALKNANKIAGEISRIYPTIDPVTRKGTIEIELETIPDGAKPGQLCRVVIYTPPTERMLIDAAAIQYDNSGKFVYRINADNTVQKINIQTGLQIENNIEILNGLKDKDLIVTEGFSNLKNGVKIKIVNKKNITNKLKSTETKN